MTSVREKAADFWQKITGLLRTRRDTTPIDSVAKLNDFVATRSAYIAQKTLYGYVKARMGIRYPAMFEDAKVVASLNIAKVYVFAACLSDLTIYAVANALHDQPVGNNEREAFARRCYESGLKANTDKAPEQFSTTGCIDDFRHRLSETDWRTSARQPESFTDSPRALFRWAPIADNLKKFDSEIIENSIKFSWRDVREQFQKRIDTAAVGADWTRQTAN